MPVHLSRSLYDRIIGLAQAEPEREICGLLLGEGACITDIRPAANVAANAAIRFEIDPAVLLHAHREARGGGAHVIGHYHSHPGGSREPSAADAADAGPDGLLWLIVGGDTAQLWRAGSRGLHGRFWLEQLVVAQN